jgi:hypothetical protein
MTRSKLITFVGRTVVIPLGEKGRTCSASSM